MSSDPTVLRLTRFVRRFVPMVPEIHSWPGFRPLVGRLHDRLVLPAQIRASIRRAHRRRRHSAGTVFIGVTGSVGKTTTKDLISAVLASRSPVVKSSGSGNELHDLAGAIGRLTAHHRFAVLEVGAPAPGAIDASLALLRPDVGVITSVATDHYSAYGSLDAIAAEKSKLVRALPSDGLAVLNADDPRVLAMRESFGGRVLTFGLQPGADVRAEEIAAAWPDRLAFTVVHGTQTVRVQTQLCGTHWVSAALAAVAVGLAQGIPLADAARALGDVEPFRARMSPAAFPDGVTFIRDDWKASLTTIAPALDFLRQARAARKVLIMGTISDSASTDNVYAGVARQALAVSDLVCFVGPRAFSAMRAKSRPGGERLHAFGTVKAASDFLHDALRPGDLVMLKGSNTADHLFRIMLSRSATVACWRDNCRKNGFCDTCSLLNVPSAAASVAVSEEPLEPSAGKPSPEWAPSWIIVGLGNPGGRFAATPHNVGQAAVDRLARAMDATWRTEGTAITARGELDSRSVCLVKLTTTMNDSGPALRALTDRLGIGPERCLLVFDDNDLPLGTLKLRLRGGDGGHRGVRSVLEAFQTDTLPRMKIGVRREGQKRPAANDILQSFDPDEQRLIDAALDEAVRRKFGEALETAVTTHAKPIQPAQEPGQAERG